MPSTLASLARGKFRRRTVPHIAYLTPVSSPCNGKHAMLTINKVHGNAAKETELGAHPRGQVSSLNG